MAEKSIFRENNVNTNAEEIMGLGSALEYHLDDDGGGDGSDVGSRRKNHSRRAWGWVEDQPHAGPWR